MRKFEGHKPGDLVVHVESLEFCTKTVSIRNGAATAVEAENFVGFPLKAGASGADYTLAVAGDEDDVVALLMDGPPGMTAIELAATTNSGSVFQALIHAPCIINRDRIRATDGADADFDIDAIVAALEALGWEVRSEPTESSEMTI